MDSEVLEGKNCTKCCKFKSFKEYHRTNKTKSGLRADCKVCRLQEKTRRNYKKEYSKYRNSILEYQKK